MLPKKERISTALFPSINKRGKQFSFGHLTFKYTKDPTQQGRFSFVVSSGVSKKANKRNKIKRRGYSIIQRNKDIKNTPLAGVFFAKKGIEKVPYGKLKEEINYIIKEVVLFLK